MYQNPFAVKPGEKLTSQQLLDRFLSWNEYRTENGSYSIKSGCDPDLWKGHLCCEDHFNYSHEYDDFFRYFCHVDLMRYSDGGFDNKLVKNFILKFGLEYELDKLAKFMHLSDKECQEFLSR